MVPVTTGVIDLHAHPMLKAYLFRYKFWKKHRPPKGFFPLCMRTDLDALLDGDVRCLLMATYIIESGFRELFSPLRILLPFYPRLRRMMDAPPDDMTFEMLDFFEAHIEETRTRRGDVVEIARNYAEMQAIMASGRLCVVHAVEGGHSLNGKLENVDKLAARGVAYLTLAHLYPNEAAHCVDGFPELRPLRAIGCLRHHFDLNLGITDFGKQVLERMFEVGIIADMTHCTPVGRKQVYGIRRGAGAQRPLVMTHVGVHEFAPYPMNPTPEDIREIADSGGVVGFIFMDHWIDQPPARIAEETVLKTVDHLIQHGGEEVVAFGSDFDGFTGVPRDFASPRDFRRLRTVLEQKYTGTQVEKFLSGNADRVLRTGWGTA